MLLSSLLVYGLTEENGTVSGDGTGLAGKGKKQARVNY
jgi:hypothetical protein